MNKLIEKLKSIWNSIDPIVELFIYLGIAYILGKLVNITFIQATTIVFVYFILSLCREAIKLLVRPPTQ